MLHSTPRYLHRFYTDISTMSHNDVEGGQSFTVASQKARRLPISSCCLSLCFRASPCSFSDIIAVFGLFAAQATNVQGSEYVSVQAIHEKVMLLDFDDAITEIWSVDCQHSANDGVLVQVAGSLQCKVCITSRTAGFFVLLSSMLNPRWT